MRRKGFECVMPQKNIVADGQNYIVYGVKVSNLGAVAVEDDVSLNKKAVTDLIKDIKRLKIEPEFLHDVVEDFVFGEDCDYVIVQKDNS